MPKPVSNSEARRTRSQLVIGGNQELRTPAKSHTIDNTMKRGAPESGQDRSLIPPLLLHIGISPC